jgi:hypothetical protein
LKAYLRSDVAFVPFGETVVILDISANRYFQLPPRLAYSFLAAVNEPGRALRVEDRQRLEDAHLLSRSPTVGPLTGSCLGLPQAGEEAGTFPHKLNIMAIRAAFAKLVALGWIRFAPFASVMARLRRLKAQSRRFPDGERQRAMDISTAFRASRQLLSDVERCMPSSMALAAALWKARVPAELVFGVRLSPFQAHSWVQWDGLVLNDHIDHVRPFRPILVL